MGFFQDLKEDLSLAVNELLPNDEEQNAQTEQDAAAEDSVEELLKEAGAVSDEQAEPTEEAGTETVLDEPVEEAAEAWAVKEDEETVDEVSEETAEEAATESDELPEEKDEALEAEAMPVEADETAEEEDNDSDITAAIADALDKEADETIAGLSKEIEMPGVQTQEPVETSFEKEVYDAVMENDNDKKQVESELEKAVDEVMEERVESVMGQDVIDETAIITKGMKVNGDISSQGSMDVFGDIKGNIEVLGKLNVAGSIEGNSNAAEVFSDAAHITGDIHATGSIKVGLNSVIIGNIYATSAVIAGAIKGDIDVHGPVVLDSSAIVMGNIKSKSVQMNNGAVIEGLCSQCYADVSPAAFFKDIK